MESSSEVPEDPEDSLLDYIVHEDLLYIEGLRHYAALTSNDDNEPPQVIDYEQALSGSGEGGLVFAEQDDELPGDISDIDCSDESHASGGDCMSVSGQADPSKSPEELGSDSNGSLSGQVDPETGAEESIRDNGRYPGDETDPATSVQVSDSDSDSSHSEGIDPETSAQESESEWKLSEAANSPEKELESGIVSPATTLDRIASPPIKSGDSTMPGKTEVQEQPSTSGDNVPAEKEGQGRLSGTRKRPRPRDSPPWKSAMANTETAYLDPDGRRKSRRIRLTKGG